MDRLLNEARTGPISLRLPEIASVVVEAVAVYRPNRPTKCPGLTGNPFSPEELPGVQRPAD